jgi:hypothetical protein
MLDFHSEIPPAIELALMRDYRMSARGRHSAGPKAEMETMKGGGRKPNTPSLRRTASASLARPMSERTCQGSISS